MTNLTYTQAVQIFQKRAAELDRGLHTLTGDIQKFLINTRKYLEKSERSKEKKALKKLEKKLLS